MKFLHEDLDKDFEITIQKFRKIEMIATLRSRF
jgi:hypothetical protein